MKGPTPEAEAKKKSRPRPSNTVTIGIIHHIFCRQKKTISSPAIPKRPPMSRRSCMIYSLTGFVSYQAIHHLLLDLSADHDEETALGASCN